MKVFKLILKIVLKIVLVIIGFYLFSQATINFGVATKTVKIDNVIVAFSLYYVFGFIYLFFSSIFFFLSHLVRIKKKDKKQKVNDTEVIN